MANYFSWENIKAIDKNIYKIMHTVSFVASFITYHSFHRIAAFYNTNE